MPLFDTNVCVIATLGPNPGLMHETRGMLETVGDVLLPALWVHEFNHVLVRQNRKQGEGHVTKPEARLARRAADLLVDYTLQHEDHAAVLDLALHFNCSGYDAEFIYWAIELDMPLITNDLKLCRTVPAHTLPLRDYLVQR